MKKNFTILLLIISFCFFITSLVSTYAMYSSEYEKLTTINLTKWKLYVNDSDIAKNSDFSETITPTYIDNPHISNGIIAPTSEGYFDIEIDCSNTNLSFSYTININTLNSNVPDFKLVGYCLNNGDIIPTTTPNITGKVFYNDNIDTIPLRIYIQWDDSNENITNNSEDTKLSKNNSFAHINATILFEQITDTYNF